jgi:RhtB (resistance to homoserine/threonine) family protein
VTHSFLAFAVFAAVVTITPGADTLLIIRTAAVSGRRAGLAAMAGVVMGCLVWATLSAVGVTAVINASRLAFEVLRAAGVAYLVWLGIAALRGSRRSSGPPESGPAPVRHRASFRSGLTTNLLNPKVGAFYLSVMPAFLPAGVPPLAGALGLGAIHAAEGAIWLSGLVLAVGRARAMLIRPRVARTLERISGVVFIGFGVRLALEKAPG